MEIHHILLIALLVTAMALLAAGFLFFRYYHKKREMNRHLVKCIRRKDQISRELEHTRIEKETLEKVIQTLKTLLLTAALAMLATQTPMAQTQTATAAGKHVATFYFVPAKDAFYVPWRGNGDELTRLYNLVDQYRQEIADGRIPIYVESYCASMTSPQENLQVARIRANRVKSELITNKGMREEYFRTRNYASAYRVYRDVVVVTMSIPEKEVEVEKEVEEVKVEEKVEEIKREVKKETEETVPVPVPPVEPVKPIAPAYRFALRTNLLYDAFLQPALGIEWRTSRNFGIKVDGTYSRWGGEHGKVQKIWLINPELRWYMGAPGRFYLGASGNYGRYNTYGYPVGKLWPDNTGYQGKLWNAGLTLGYQLYLSRSFSLDFNLGLGYNSYEYDSFEMIEGTRVYRERNKSNEFFGPTQGGVHLIWTIR